MTPRYAQDGQVYEMIVEKRAKTDEDIIFGSSFAEKEWKDVVDELVPPRKRGKDATELPPAVVALRRLGPVQH
jgi:hypothetical protein